MLLFLLCHGQRTWMLDAYLRRQFDAGERWGVFA